MNYFGEFNDFYDNFDVPSGDDVTDLFAAAGQGTLALRRMIRCTLTQCLDMEPEEVILMDGFGLADAMSVFEVCRALLGRYAATYIYTRQQIGEPRLDSGMSLEEQPRPPFNPLTPLLPEEICWILDRSFACEVNAHPWTYAMSPPEFFISICFVGTDGMAFREDALSERVHHPLRAPYARYQP